MVNAEPTYLTADEVAKLPEYARCRNIRNTLLRHRLIGLKTRNGETQLLRSRKLAGGIFYTREDVSDFWRAVNGEDEDGAAPAYSWKPNTPPTPAQSQGNLVEDAEAEMAAAGLL